MIAFRVPKGSAARTGRLSPRSGVPLVAVLFGLSLLAWQSTIDQAHSMSGMAMGLGQIGVRAQGDMGAVIFLTMWAAMMAAMMLPTLAPIALAHLVVAQRRGDGVLSTLAFVCGYMLIWTAIGVAPMLAYWSLAALPDEAGSSRWLGALAGSILMVAGIYQFTAWKRVCLDKCQSPFAFLMSHDFGGGAASALRAGIVHGVYCLGCCWALMSVLAVVGLMNLVWMVGIFVLVLVEKNWTRGLALARWAGSLLIALGIAMIGWPAVLPWASQ